MLVICKSEQMIEIGFQMLHWRLLTSLTTITMKQILNSCWNLFYHQHLMIVEEKTFKPYSMPMYFFECQVSISPWVHPLHEKFTTLASKSPFFLPTTLICLFDTKQARELNWNLYLITISSYILLKDSWHDLLSTKHI